MTQPTPSGYQPGMDPRAQAKAEKAYAKATRPWFKKKRFIIPIALVALVIISSLFRGGGEAPVTTEPASTAAAETEPAAEKAKEKKSEPAPKKETKAELVKVSAAELIKAFEKNELAADKRFKDKDLKITGVVAKIDTDVWDDDKYILELGGGGDFELLLVRCHDMPSDELEKLSVGDKTTVVGAFDDGGDLGVDVRQCRLS